MPGAVYICNPGGYTGPGAEVLCRCKHPRADHWFGGGNCGECARCPYFRPQPKGDAR